MALGVYFLLLTLSVLFGASVQQPVTCSAGWTQFQNSCYLFVKEEATWDEANTGCAARGAILAEPDTREEYEFVVKFNELWVWLGGTDHQNEGTWVWRSSGKPVDSSLWAHSEPDSYFGDEDCLAHYRSSTGWFDEPCSLESYYMCEKPANV